MKQKHIMVCDTDPNYAGLFSGYLMDYLDGASISIFCNPNSFLMDDGQYDVGILGKDFLDLLAVKERGQMYSCYYLSEEDGDSSYSPMISIYKYQPMEVMISKIEELNEVTPRQSKLKHNHKEGMPNLVGVYSPIAHELQLPFSMALGQLYKEAGKVLFLDFEEISILSKLLDLGDEGRNLSDLIYLSGKQNSNVYITDYTYEFEGMDFILPFSNPEEINELNSATFEMLLSLISRADYSTVVILFGRSTKDFAEILDSLDELVLLGREGDYFDKSFLVFDQYLKSSSISAQILSVQLPLTASSLRDGSYCLEELLTGNLGVFVKRLMNRASYG